MKAPLVSVLVLLLFVVLSPTTFAATHSYVDIDTLLVIYTKWNSGQGTTIDITEDVDFLTDKVWGVREFFWRASNLRCHMNLIYNQSQSMDYLVITDELTPSDMTNNGNGLIMLSPDTVEADLIARGVDDGEYSMVIALWAFEYGDGYAPEHGGLAYWPGAILEDTAFTNIPTVWWDNLDGYIRHELEHLLDFFYELSDNPGGNDICHPDRQHLFEYAMDCQWDFQFQCLNVLDPGSWLQLDSKWATVQYAQDSDSDGVPDSGNLPIVDTDSGSEDDDGDGLDDFDEVVLLYHGYADPEDVDTDDDTDEDGDDPHPLYATANLDIGGPAPTINGTIAAGEWTEVTHVFGTESDFNATIYARWVSGTLYLAAEINDDQVTNSDELQLRIDTRRDGFLYFDSNGNYRIACLPTGSGSSGAGTVYAYDRDTAVPHDYYSISTSGIECEYSKTSTAYDIELAIPASALPVAPLEVGGPLRIAFGFIDDDATKEDFDIFTGAVMEDPGFIELNLTGGGGGGDVAMIGSWEDSGSYTNNSSISYDHTAPSGSDRLLVVTVHSEDQAVISASAEYGGRTMTKQIDQIVGSTYRAYAAVFTLDESGIQAAGSNDTLEVTFTQSVDTSGCSSVFFENVDQSTPIGDSDSASVTNNSSLSTSALTTADGDMVVLAGTCGDDDQDYNVYNDFLPDPPHQLYLNSADGVVGYKEADGSNETPSVYYSGANRQVLIGLVLQASGGGGSSSYDTTGPTPDPLGWATAPHATGTSSISMTAQTADDANYDVEYFFECLANDDATSGWQDSPTYEATGLYAETTYEFRVRARDKSPAKNPGGWSDWTEATTDSPTLMYEINFESGYGTWSNVGDYDWTRTDDATPTANTGPDEGSEWGQGSETWYAYLETDSAYSDGDTAILESELITATDVMMTFDWHMYGDDIGDLYVDVYSEGQWHYDIASVHGEQQTSSTTSFWSTVANMSTFESPLRIRIRAVAGGGNLGDIAIDHIQVFGEGGTGGGDDVEIVGSWTTSTGSHSHTEESGTDRLLVFTIHCEDGDSTALNASAATYGGQSMTKVTDCSHYTAYGEEYVAVFVLNDAGIDAASSSSFGVTWTGGSPSQTAAFSSVFLQNVDQSTPIGANASSYGTSSTVSTSSLSTDDGDMALVAGTVGNTGSYTVNNGFTEAVELSPSSADGVTGYKEATGDNETPSVTHSNVNRQVLVGVVVNHD